MRQQVGRLTTLGKLFFFSRSKQHWDYENLPTLRLYFVPRYETYAESYDEYYLRREIYINYNVELPRELVKESDWNRIDEFLAQT